MIDLPPAVLRQIPKLLWDMDVERVAIFVGNVRNHQPVIRDIWPAENLHHDPADNFALTRVQFDAIKKRASVQGMRVLGIVHSHPPGTPEHPSEKDLRLCPHYLPAMALYCCGTTELVWYGREGETGRLPIKPPLGIRIAMRLLRSNAGSVDRSA